MNLGDISQCDNYERGARARANWILEDHNFIDNGFNFLHYYDPKNCKYSFKYPITINNNNSKIYKEKEEKSMFENADNFFGKIFGKVNPNMCRMSMDGSIAVKTNNGYKTYDVTSGNLTNCNNFVFDIGSEFFFIIPTNKVEKGDIILSSGKPHCVIEAKPNEIRAMRYEDGTIVTIVPEKHYFMKRTYFYGKIVSMFGDMMSPSKGDKGMNNMFRYMMLSEMMKGNGGNTSSMLPMMMLMNGNGFENMFGNMFGDEEEDKKGE